MLGEILTFAPLTAPEPTSTDEPLLVITKSAPALRVAVVLPTEPLVRISMFPVDVWRDSLIVIGDVFVEDPIVIELGLLVKEIDDGKSKKVAVDEFRRVVPCGLNVKGPETSKAMVRLVLIRSASKVKPPETLKTVEFAEIPVFPAAAPAAV